MSQAIRKSSRSQKQIFVTGMAVLLILSAVGVNTWAEQILRTRTDTLDHNVDKSAFFTNRVDGGAYAKTDESWFPKETAKAGEALSTTPTKTYSIVGTSTSGGNWIDGNGVPAGLTLNFTAEFTITALPLSGGSFLTNPGNGTTGTAHGRGIGITQTLNGLDDIDKPDGFQASAATISGLSFDGALTEPGFTFTPGGVSNLGTRVFRSNNFDEAVAGMLLTQGTETIGFGLSTGTLVGSLPASNLIASNNFGSSGGTEPPSSIFDRRVGPYTLVVDGPTQTNNVSVIKGIGIAYDVTYDITAVPAPLTGDYDANGTVDAADYVVWREGSPAADGNGDTMVDEADYDVWRANFGNPGPGAGAGNGGAVPEPAALMLIVVGLLAAMSRRGFAARR